MPVQMHRVAKTFADAYVEMMKKKHRDFDIQKFLEDDDDDDEPEPRKRQLSVHDLQKLLQ